MILTHLGLSSADQRELLHALKDSQHVKVRVKLMNLDGGHLRDLTDYLDDGQVTGDATLQGQADRTATLTFHDPRQTLPFETDSPADTALALDRMIRVLWEIYVEALTDWVSIPVFTGPVTGMERTGEQVTVTCQGKEWFALGACWHPLHLNKRMKKTAAIRRILSERAGETRFHIPDLAPRLPRAQSLHRQAVPWHRARKIAHSMDRRLFYDGAGTCRLETHPRQPRFSFTGQSHVTGQIQVSYNAETVNAVYVFGADPKGPKTHVTASAVAPANHLLSPVRLGRNGVPRYLAKFINDSALKTSKEAQARADRVLADGLAQSVQVQFECAPVPLLDLGDMCHVHTDDGDVTFRLRQFTLPLRVGDGAEGASMTVGYTKRLTRQHPRHQHRRHHHRRR